MFEYSEAQLVTGKRVDAETSTLRGMDSLEREEDSRFRLSRVRSGPKLPDLSDGALCRWSDLRTPEEEKAPSARAERLNASHPKACYS